MRTLKSYVVYAAAVAVLVLILAQLYGCAETGPKTKMEMWPTLNQDSQLGLIILEGSPAVNIWFYDQAGRLVEQWAEKGTSPVWTYNGQTKARGYPYQLAIGQYTVRVRPFYYETSLLFIRRLVELPEQSFSVYVGRNPSTQYESRFTQRYWGWVLSINTGEIPQSAYMGPKIDISGTGWLKGVVNGLGGRR